MTLNHRRLTAEQTALIEEYRSYCRISRNRYLKRVGISILLLTVSVAGALATGMADILLIAIPCTAMQILYKEN